GSVAKTGVAVSQVNTSTYSVTVSGISGAGTLGLNLKDDGTIHDVSGNQMRPNAATEGTFQTFIRGGNPVIARFISPAEVNNGGKAELIFDQGAGVIGVFLGNGNGSFIEKDITVGNTPDSVVSGDLNGDGLAEIVAASTTGSVNVLLNVGPSTYFQPQG